jgi:hypothetical protein
MVQICENARFLLTPQCKNKLVGDIAFSSKEEIFTIYPLELFGCVHIGYNANFLQTLIFKNGINGDVIRD